MLRNPVETQVSSTAFIQNECAKFSSSSSESKTIEPHADVKKYDVVIVGAGLGGLTATYEAAKAGKTVLVIESRHVRYAAIRPQLIFLDPQNMQYLRTLPKPSDDNKTADKILFPTLNTPGHFSIKNIQRFLLSRIDRKYCTFRYESVVSEINLNEGYLIAVDVNDVTRQEKVSFANLVLADGAKHQTANLLKPHIEYQPVASRPEKKHVMGYFTVKSKNGEPIRNPMNFLAGVIHENNCGLIYYESKLIENDNQSSLKICIVMNVSDQQFEQYQANKELGIKFLKHCITGVFDEADWEVSMTNSVKSGNEKDKLKYAAFTLDFIEANKSAFEVNGHTVILIGDTRRTPDFYQGHGGNDAMLDGQQAAKIVKKELSIQTYNTFTRERSKSIGNQTLFSQPILKVFKEETLQKFTVAAFEDDIVTTAAIPRSPVIDLSLFLDSSEEEANLFSDNIKDEAPLKQAGDLQVLRN